LRQQIVGGPRKAEVVFQSVIMQEDFQIIGTRALAYPLAFAIVLSYQLEARDALHLSVAALGGVTTLITSDANFADGVESMIEQVALKIFGFPNLLAQFTGLATEKQCSSCRRSLHPSRFFPSREPPRDRGPITVVMGLAVLMKGRLLPIVTPAISGGYRILAYSRL
jgi:hypothetical protein